MAEGVGRSGRDRAAAELGRRLAALTEAARMLLAALGETRFLHAGQIARLLPAGDPAQALRQLRAGGLVVRLLHRPDPQGPPMQVYTLSAFGERAARALRSHAAGEGGAYDPAVDVRRESSSRARREGDLLSYLFLTHHLAVSDLYVSLRALYEGPNPVIWRTGPSARVTFRSFLNSEGRSTVVPDALVGRSVDAAIGEPAEAVAVELDRGTMGRVAIEKKLLRYRELFAERGRRWPILFVAEDAARRRWLSGRLSDARLVGASFDREGSSLALVAWLEEGDRAFVAVSSPPASSQPT